MPKKKGKREKAKLARNIVSPISLKTEFKQSQEANRIKSDFLANLSHELRTPLNAIIGFSELIHDEKVGHVSAEQKEYLQDILISSKHLLQLINDVLDLSKIEAGKMEFHPEKISLPQVLGEVTDILRTLINQKHLHLTTNVESTLRNILIDRSRLKQVIYNFLSNAIKFTPEFGSIEIRAFSEKNNFFRLEIEDTGIGIKPENLNKLFTEFQPIDSGITKRYAGTGLGLALTKKIVEAQNGKVGVNSTEKKGSLFFAILPQQHLLKEKEKTPEKTIPKMIPEKELEPILVVEDEKREADWMMKVLSAEGYAVELADSGENAIRKSQTKQYHVITLDILLPDMNGWMVLQKIRESINKTTPIILISVAANENQGSGFSFADRLLKPITKEDLIFALNRAKNQRRMRRIFAIDKDQYSLKLLSKLIREEGIDLTTFKDPIRGLKTATEIKPDIIIVDLMMTHMNAAEFLSQYQTSELKKIPLIIWTAKDISTKELGLLKQLPHVVVLKNIANSAYLLLKEIKELTQSRTAYA